MTAKLGPARPFRTFLVFFLLLPWLWAPAPHAAAGADPGRGPADLLAVPAAELPRFVRERYRLRPDRRLLLAIAELRRLRGQPPSEVAVELRGGRWRVLAGGAELGTLAEFPTFDEAMALLVRLAGPAPPAAAGAPAGPDAVVELAIREADLLGLAAALEAPGVSPRSQAAGFAWLATLVAPADQLDLADPLFAVAWARVAAAREPRGETLLARALGYEGAAAKLAAGLAKDDPVRLYALGDESGLLSLCAGRAELSCRYLRLALLAERGRDQEFGGALARSAGRSGAAVDALKTRLPSIYADEAGQGLARAALLAVGTGGGAGNLEFETALARQPDRQGGAFGPAGLAAFYRSLYYSGLFSQARFALDNRASGPQARVLAEKIAPADGVGGELKRYLEVRAELLEGSRNIQPAVGLLASSRQLGAFQLHELARIVARQTATTDPRRRQALPAVFLRLDTRPAHRVAAARLARYNLTSPGLVEVFAAAAAEAAPHGSEELPASAAELREDKARLRQIAADRAMPQYARVVALDSLAELGKVDDDFVRRSYEILATDADGSTDWLIDFLEQRGQLAAAVAALDAALARQDDDGLLGAYLRSKKARLELLLGRPEAAAATIAPALDTLKEDALLEGAAVELARRRPEPALRLARQSLERYPDRCSEAAGLAARARWQLGQGAALAKELAANPCGILDPWNVHLPNAFVAAFGEGSEAAARQAFGELVAAGLPHRALVPVAIALGKKRGLELALPLLAGLRDPAPEWRERARLETYDLIREKAGPAPALAWVRQEVAERSHHFALDLYQMRRYELLLGLYANGEEGDNARVVRLVKAAAHLHLGETRGPRWDGLVAAVQKDGDDEFPRLTRVLLDRGDGAALLQTIADTDLASLGWVMGVKAATAGRFADADGWFQVAIESGMQGQPPHAWSWVIESDWLQAQRSLELLGKRQAFHPDQDRPDRVRQLRP